MIHQKISTTINLPATEIYPYISEFNLLRQWLHGLIGEEHLSAPTNGYKYKQILSQGGGRMEVLIRFLEKTPPTYLVFEGSHPSFYFKGSYCLEDRQGVTQITYELQTHIFGIWKLFSPLIRHQSQRKLEADFKNLKALVEGKSMLKMRR